MSLAALAGTALAVAAGATAQSVTGFGYALLVAPVLAVLIGPKAGVVAMTAVGIPLVAWNSVRWREAIQRREATIVTGAALVGMPLGLVLLTKASERALLLVVGSVVLVLTWALWRGVRLPTGRPTELAAGVTSGALAGSVGTNGPPLVIAFQAAEMPPEAFRATLQVTFFMQACVAFVGFWATGHVSVETAQAFAVGVPAAIAGTLVGDRLSDRTDRARFRQAVLALLTLSGVAALIGAFTR